MQILVTKVSNSLATAVGLRRRRGGGFEQRHQYSQPFFVSHSTMPSILAPPFELRVKDNIVTTVLVIAPAALRVVVVIDGHACPRRSMLHRSRRSTRPFLALRWTIAKIMSTVVAPVLGLVPKQSSVQHDGV